MVAQNDSCLESTGQLVKSIHEEILKEEALKQEAEIKQNEMIQKEKNEQDLAFLAARMRAIMN